MKYNIKSLLTGLVTLGFILSCAQAPQQIAKKNLAPDLVTKKTQDSTVHIVSQTEKPITLGSGFFVDKDKIATNIHVVAQPGPIFAELSNKKRKISIEGVAAFDVKNNLVILKLAGEGPPLPLGDSDTIQKGESVSVVDYVNGSPEAKRATIDSTLKSNQWFWMKAATFKENRGGPVLNKTGQVIGINVGYGDVSHNYVIPSNALKVLLAKTYPLEPLSEWQKRKHIRAEVNYSRGETKYFAKDYKNAIVEFDKAIELNPEHIRAFYKRGNSKFKLENYTGAIDNYTHAIKINPQHARAYYNRGHAKFKLENYISAIDDYTHAIKINPENARAYIYRGSTKFRLENYVGAIDDYTHAIKINPENAVTYSNRGGVKIRLGESKSEDGDAEKARQLYQEAIDDCTHAIKIDPKSVNAYINRSRALMQLADTKADQGNIAEAKQLYQEVIDDCTHAIKINSQSVDAYKNRGIAKAALGDVASEHGEEEKALSLYRSGITDYYKLADTNLSKLDSEEGRKSTVRVMSWTGTSSGFFCGSGFFVDNDKIVTNIHVVDMSGPVFVKLIDKETIWVVKGVTAFDAENDLAILKIEGEGPPLILGNSDVAEIGESVIAVGYPGKRYKVSTGTIHGTKDGGQFLLTTVDTASGSSGGPILNSKNEVIGIHVSSNNSTSSAIPSNILKPLLEQSEFVEPLPEWQKRAQILAYVYFSKGKKKTGAENYEAAIVDFNKAIQLNPEYARAYFESGFAKYKSGDHIGAIDDYTQAIKFNPQYALAYNNRGNRRRSLGTSKASQGDIAEAHEMYEAAIKDFTRAIQSYPKYALAYNNRGRTQREFGKSKADQGYVAEAQRLYKNAIEDHTHAININPEYTDAYFKRGIQRRHFGSLKADNGNIAEAQQLYKDAIDDYTQAIELSPKYAMAYNNRGWVKYLSGKSKADQGDAAEAQQLYQAAIEDYTQAIKINPKHVLAYTNRGNAKKALGQHEAAEKDFAKAKELESEK